MEEEAASQCTRRRIPSGMSTLGVRTPRLRRHTIAASHGGCSKGRWGVTELNLIVGRPDALRDEVAKRIVAHREQDLLAPIYILVGASLQRPYLSRWLAARVGGHANVQVLMPGDLALILGAPKLVGEGRRALPPLADRVLLAQVAAAGEGYFAPVAATAGFAEAMYRLVRELKGAGFDLADLGDAIDGCTDAVEKASALTELLAGFEERRKAFYGPDDALQVAEPALLDGVGLLVYGLLDPSPLMERLLNGVSAHMPVDVYLPDLSSSDSSPAGAWRARLESDGVVSTEAKASPHPPNTPTALGALRDRLFTTPELPAISPDESVRLVSGPDPSREVKAAARACLAWAADGIPFWDMAIAYRQGDAYRPLVEAVFAEAGIPVYIHEGSPVAERPLGRRTLALLDLYETDFSRQSVMDFLSDARLPSELHKEFDGIPAARWDSVSREAGIVGGAEQWASRLAALAGDLDREDAAAWRRERGGDAARLARFIADLDERMRDHPPRSTWAAHLDFLSGLLGRYVLDAQQIVQALRGLERFTALEAEVAFETFLDVVRRAVGTLRSEEVLQGQAGAFARRGVNALAVNSLPGLEFAHVWILGITERQFPPPARQDPILLDPERAAISGRSGRRLALRGDRGSEEELLFALACESARERLVVSYARRASGESRPRLPSVFFREIASHLEGKRISAEQAPLLVRPDVDRIPGDAIGSPTPGGRNAADRETVSRAAALSVSPEERDRTYLQADVTRPVGIGTFEQASPPFARALIAAAARRSDRYSEWDGALGSDARDALDSLVAGRVLSPTAIQNYAACPQSFLMSNVLGAKALEEPERTVRIDSLRRGNLFHRVFERFHEEWEGAGAPALAPQAHERMQGIAEEECAEAASRGETGYPAMWAADRAEIVEDCLRWLEHEQLDPNSAQLLHSACEARFGPPYSGEPERTLSRDEPLEIDLGGRTLRISGRIDRVSWDATPPTRFRVIDYKTGKVRDERAGQLQGGRMLQLPLYVLAAAGLLGVDPTAGEAAYIYPTRRGDFKTVDWSAETMVARHEEVLGVLGEIADGIGRGDFMVAPWDAEKACRYCDLKGICPTPRADYVDRREADERVEPLLQRIRSVE
jgi:ATP-dependent helicase/nuclease subunit B